jgi:D-cysteine desulfhydrase/L-cysteate sulfo-lyase
MTELVNPSVSELSAFPKTLLGHYPTPLELLPRLSEDYPGHNLYVKRDDCTGLGMGGNKVRQLEFYLGDAVAKGCDTVLSTGAIQSNYMRTIAAAASKLGLDCHIQLEDRVPDTSEEYHTSGNRLLSSIFGATISYFPEGGDEEAADAEINGIAEQLANQGKKPYVVPLKPVKQPKGALGYIECAKELLDQCVAQSLIPDLIVVGSGSGMTHSGLLFGLRLLGADVSVLGACVRREAKLQGPRVYGHCQNLEEMLGTTNTVTEGDVWVDDGVLAPGYGQMSDFVKATIYRVATREGLLLDPVYSGKSLACLLNRINTDQFSEFKNIVFIHTGGTPAIFAYQKEMSDLGTPN